MLNASSGAARGLALLAVLSLSACAERVVHGQLAPTAPSREAPELAQEALEPNIADALRRMSTTLAVAPALTVRMTAQREGRLPNGQVVLLGATSVVLARRPDRLAAVVGSDLGSFALWYDGARVTVLSPVRNAYASSPLTGGLEDAVVWIEDRLGLEIPIRPLVAKDPYAALLEAGTTTGVHVGRSVLRDVAVDHYAFRNPDADWEIWLEAGSRPLPRRVSVVGRGDRGPGRTTIDFDDWNLAPHLPDRTFAFTPPPGAVPATLILRRE
jgi:hypothetical protein